MGDYQNLTTYKLFQQTYKSRIQAANPKVPQPKLMMLLAAKWREFQASAPADEPDEEVEEEPEVEEEFEEEEDDDDRRRSKKGSSKKDTSVSKSSKGAKGGKAGSSAKKGKVPTLKIKLGGRGSGKRSKNASSEDEEDNRKAASPADDSDAEFEEMLKIKDDSSDI